MTLDLDAIRARAEQVRTEHSASSRASIVAGDALTLADEVDRLRAEVNSWPNRVWSEMVDERDRLRARVAELREAAAKLEAELALQEKLYAEQTRNVPHEKHPFYPTAIAAARVKLRAALAQEPKP
jgi:hypothetical protein